MSVQGRREPALEPMDLDLSTGECVLVAAEPGHGHTALALVATGRLRPFAGTVELVEGHRATRSSRALRAVTAVVDVPGVNEPEEALTVADVVAEGLALARRRSLPPDVSRWLADQDLADERRRRVDQLPGVLRTSLLAELAAADRDVRFVVLTVPDRHGGDPWGWWSVAETLAATGYGVLVQCTRSSARDLGVDLPPARGRTMHDPPLEVLRTRPELPAAPVEVPPDPPSDDDADAETAAATEADVEAGTEEDTQADAEAETEETTR
ncbi:hypothetical protein [Isoptericola sp. BMS4]|uniref:hypothetical protein n=1 Tax=Isoptericola sp. BMS4 TaxID=2527875 RepID=UPI0014218B54|nr:hypothetical protein [Isoptericola sp. BMS4]